MANLPNRHRLPLATTVDPDIAWLVNALSEVNLKGQFLDEVISGWVTECAWFDIPSCGGVQLKNEGLYYQWHDYNNEEQGPKFRTFREAFTWLKTTHPDVNYNIKL